MADQTMDQQHQSALNQVNSVIDKGKSAYNNAKRLKKAVQAGRTVVQGVQTGASILVALFSSGVGEILLILLAIGIGAFLLVIVVSIITGASNTNADTTCTTQTITTTGTPSTFTGNVSDYFAISGGTAAQRSSISTIVLYSLNEPGVPSLLKNAGNIKIIISSFNYVLDSNGNQAWLTTNGQGGTITVYQYYFTKSSAYNKNFYINHEIGHAIANSNNLNATFYNYSFPKDPSCYNSNGIIKTFPFYKSTLTEKQHESFAEAYADSIFCKANTTCIGTIPIPDFPGTCSNTYNWMVKNVLGASGSSTQNITVCVTPTPGPSSAPVAGGPYPWSAFDALVAGQGRNTSALGNSATAFINAVKSRVGSGTNDEANPTYLTQIYNAAVAKNVNPAILLTIWGVEQNFRANTSLTFGCFYDSMTGFSLNLQCAVNTLNNHMSDFKPPSTQIHSVNPTYPDPDCTYTDMFSYAYEWYTPVCHANDSNDPYRKNFISIYKKIMGL